MVNGYYLATFVRMFFEDYVVCQRHLSLNTIRSYRDAVKLLIPFVAARAGKRPTSLLVADVTDRIVVAFLQHLEEQRRNSVQTRNNRLVALRKLFGYIALQEPVLADHCRRVIQIPTKKAHEVPEISYLEKHELAAILDAVDRRSKLGWRDHAMLMFMYNTGARVQETVDAKVSWLTLDPPPKVEILGKGRKWRTCPLWPEVAGILARVVSGRPTGAAPDAPLFLNRYGEAFSRFGVWNIIEKYKNRAAATMPSLAKKRITPHTFRHTTAMHLLQSGVEINVIRRWLGHVDLATTHRYVEIDLAMKRKALESCQPTGLSTGGSGWQPRSDILAWLETL
jgi:site-specific recombinase XerD